MADSSLVIIAGAGTMGAGIAQVAASHGWDVRLLDVDRDVVDGAIAGIGKRLTRLVEKGRLSDDDRAAIAGRLRAATSPAEAAGAAVVLEAVVEDLDVKTGVLGALVSHAGDDAIIATNTSSLSVTEIGRAIGQPHRTVGMHFFNPAPLMKLAEIVAGRDTDPPVADRAASIAHAWGKHVARAADVPGFIVNHVARPYYLEAFRIVEDGVAGPALVDETMRMQGGFRMGPLELTDLIGQDVNTATTRSVWERLGEPALLHPSALQERLVAEGHLGRKTGRGVYAYGGGEPAPAVEPGTGTGTVQSPPEVREAAARFAAAAARAGDAPTDERQALILARILGALIAQASLARQRGVATADDIDTALKYGTNYPRGPFEWARDVGADTCQHLLDALGGRFDVKLDLSPDAQPDVTRRA